MVDNVLARAHPTSPKADASPMDNLPMGDPTTDGATTSRAEGWRRRRKNNCPPVISASSSSVAVSDPSPLSALAARSAAVEAISTTGPSSPPTRHVRHARRWIAVGVSRIDLWRSRAGRTIIPKLADQDP